MARRRHIIAAPSSGASRSIASPIVSRVALACFPPAVQSVAARARALSSATVASARRPIMRACVGVCARVLMGAPLIVRGAHTHARTRRVRVCGISLISCLLFHFTHTRCVPSRSNIDPSISWFVERTPCRIPFRFIAHQKDVVSCRNAPRPLAPPVVQLHRGRHRRMHAVRAMQTPHLVRRSARSTESPLLL